MNNNISVYQGNKVDDQDTRLIELFNELEKKQIEFLDEAGKRIIELSTALLALLFTISAFGDKFPPSYLTGNPSAKFLIILTMVFNLLSTFAGLITVQPRKYQLWKNNLTEMREELNHIIKNKVWPFRIGSVLFGAGSISLVALVISIIWTS